MRIVYCIDSINYIGGIQRVTVTKANAMADVPDCEVWILVADNSGDRVFEVSPKVRIVDLGVDYYKDDWKSRWNVLKGIFIKRRDHRVKMRAALGRIGPDIVVSVGQSEKFFLPFIKVASKPAFIREIHFTSDYRKLNASGLFEKVSASVATFIDYHLLISRYDKIVLLSEDDRRTNWRAKARNLAVIPDPLCHLPERVSTLDNKVVIAVGRLVRVKNFSSLVRAWRKVNERFPDWELHIWGEGEEKNMLEGLISRLGLGGSVKLMGYSADIMTQYPDASIFSLSSLFEGFGMVIVEAMSCGLPVVSYDCPCGPGAIIRDGVDGFLVPPGDEDALSERICELIENEDVRRRMGKAALANAGRFDIDSVIPLWMDLFKESILKARRG